MEINADSKYKQSLSLGEKELRQMVVDELTALGFTINGGHLSNTCTEKNLQREIHSFARKSELKKATPWLNTVWPSYQRYFADGKEINPEKIQPKLIEVRTQRQLNIFRLARYTWSLPYTKGFGRRLQFLIIDEANQKLIGVLGLQSPPLSFPARDKLFKYPNNQKTALVNQTMDIYTLGAVPPYARLLGGKLIALIAACNEVRAAYARKYEDRITVMEERNLPASLVALTTTSAYGKSSLYNRLKFHDHLVAEPIGYTEGYGAFHFERLYPYFRQYLEARGIQTKGGYGTGPRVKWQVIVKALKFLGFSNELLRHGVLREVYLYPLTKNLYEIMRGEETSPEFFDLPFHTLVDFWRERWLLPRSLRVDGWHAWKSTDLRSILFDTDNCIHPLN